MIRLPALAAAGLCLLLSDAAVANPLGGTVTGGSATITTPSPGRMVIEQHTDRAVINWRDFSIGAGEITRFQQPSAAAAALNRVTGAQASRILGRLSANGRVYLVNPNGIVFGPDAVIDVAGLIASTHDIRDVDFLADRLAFTIPGTLGAGIVNDGLITAREGGLVALVAPWVENSGIIQARLGTVVIAGVNSATIDPYGDDLIVFQADSKVVESLTDPDSNPLAALVDISGEITADGGRVLITADMARGVVNSAINMTGYVQARTVETHNGEIVLKGGDAGVTAIAGTLDATGDGRTGGAIEVSGDVIMHTGALDASGATGGTVSVTGRAVFNQGRILADGGGSIALTSTGHYLATESSLISAAGTQGDGGVIVIDGGPDGSVYSSGETRTTSEEGTGGAIDVFGDDITLVAARIDASGATGGGAIRVGGDYQGGGDAPHASTVYASLATTVAADATNAGDGGTVIVWSDGETRVGAALSARGGPAGGDGGLIEVSSAGAVVFAGTADASAPLGQAGAFLLDPMNIVIDAATGTFPQFDLVDPLPGAGNDFGRAIVPLSTGNVVVTDPFNDTIAADAGAFHLFNGRTGALISTVTGSTADDRIGAVGILNDSGVVALTNGNYVIRSQYWDNGATVNTGAVTWGSGLTGVSGTLSAGNSLVGSTTNDEIGRDGVTPLTNGNYVAFNILWDNGGITNAGAATWANGATGITGAVSTGNSLHGTVAEDRIGVAGVIALTNGNYVVGTSTWDNGAAANAGAATWGDGTTGITGAVDTFNSLVGSQTGDNVGKPTALTNGNYVVNSPFWSDGATTSVGAVTWGNGATGITGPVTTGNSLHGTTAFDLVGRVFVDEGVIPLTNGNYVVQSRLWDNGAFANAGAATWVNGATGLTGPVTAGNSLVGGTASDEVGEAVTPLTNGNYVVLSRNWDNGGTVDAGAATWGNGTAGVTGLILIGNSLIGTTANDRVSFSNGIAPLGAVALANGNYVVASSLWNNGGTADAGAATWGNGTTGTVGAVSAANSLVGGTAGDEVGTAVSALTNGNYVVASPGWNNGAIDVGAVTWANGSTGITGLVNTTNSLYGTTANDQVGFSTNAGYLGAVALTNGNYVVASPFWDNGATANVGAVTWANGATGLTGAVSTANSLIGTTANDQISETNSGSGIVALAGGDYVVSSDLWDDGATVNAGAATFVNGTTGRTFDGVNVVSAGNGIVGFGGGSVLQPLPVDDSANNTFLAHFSGNGGRAVVGLTDPSQITFDRGGAITVTVAPAAVENTLDSGTAVIMQANNDIGVNSPINANNGAGNGGALTLQAGRSILINSTIVTDNGNLTLIANDWLASGVVDAQRAAGAAVIAMALGTTLDAGAGTVGIQIRSGAGKTNATSGDITLDTVIGSTVIVSNNGPTAGSDILMTGPGSSITAGPATLSGDSVNAEIDVASLSLVAFDAALTGLIAGGAGQAAADSIDLTKLGDGPFTFNGFEIRDLLEMGALSQHLAEIASLAATEPIPDGTSADPFDTDDDGGADSGDIETAVRIAEEESLYEAVAYINGDGDLSSAQQQEFFRNLEGPEIARKLKDSDDATARKIGQLFQEVIDGREIAQAEMKVELNALGVRGGRMFTYLGLFIRVHKYARTLLYAGAIRSLRRNPDLGRIRIAAPARRGRAVRGKGRKVALLIGVQDYSGPIPDLKTPAADVDAIGQRLETRLGYETKVLKNPTKKAIVAEFQKLVNTLGDEDSVVIYYAGHGYVHESTGNGYWLPADARTNSGKQWISNKSVSRVLKAIRSKRIMLIADSCYSGSLLSGEHKFKSVRLKLDGEGFDDRRSVVIMSSGGEEPVRDDGGAGHSVFARQLMTALDGIDSDSPGAQVYRSVRTRIAELAPQVPRYGGIVSAGHQIGADYVFVPRL